MIRDLRICFVGDSFVAGVGDPLCMGWAGRLAARTFADGQPLTGYNLGVRRQTSSDILARLEYECVQRLQGGNDLRVVLSFGVNDTTHEESRPRVTPEESSDNLAQMLARSADRGWPVLVVAPPPVDDEEQNAAPHCSTSASPVSAPRRPSPTYPSISRFATVLSGRARYAPATAHIRAQAATTRWRP